MPIFDQGYQHWDGKLSGHAWRWWAITRHGVAAQWKTKAVKAIVFISLLPALLLTGFLVVWGLFEQGSALLVPFLSIISSLPEELRSGPKGFRGVFWTMAFHYYFNVQLFFSMVLVLLVGPNLISQDLRYNAIPLYFSRPLRRIDYFVGKLGIIAVYVAAVSLLPAVLAYLLGVAFSLDPTVLKDTGRILLGAIGYGVVVVVSAGTLMLAISASSRNSRAVGAAWIGFWLITGMVGGILTDTVRRDWCPIVSYQSDLLRIREAMLDTASARSKIQSLFDAGRQEVRGATFFSRIGRSRTGPGRPGPSFRPTPPAPPPIAGRDASGNSTYPWQWSAGVLAGLTGLSLWTLSARVKSLDRLK